MENFEYLSGSLRIEHKDFNTHYVSAFKDLKSAGELLDVTLACEDDILEAHKVILSASSSFFRKVFSKSQNPPYIYIKGIKYEDLKNIVDFVYNGEASIQAKDVKRFLEAAKELQIKGLAPDEDTEHSTKEENDYIVPKKRERKTKIIEDIKHEQVTMEGLEEMKAKDESEGSIDSIECSDVRQETANQIDVASLQELTEEIEKNLESYVDPSGYKNWKCKICGKSNKKRTKVAHHVETHLENFSFSCEYCNKTSKTRKALKSHIYYNHTKKNNETVTQKDGE